MAQPEETLSETVDKAVKVADIVVEPAEAVNKPAEAVNKPAEAVNEPTEDVIEPAEDVDQPPEPEGDPPAEPDDLNDEVDVRAYEDDPDPDEEYDEDGGFVIKDADVDQVLETELVLHTAAEITVRNVLPEGQKRTRRAPQRYEPVETPIDDVDRPVKRRKLHATPVEDSDDEGEEEEDEEEDEDDDEEYDDEGEDEESTESDTDEDEDDPIDIIDVKK